MKPDEGNGVVILNKEDYKRKVETILNDDSKFTELHDDPVKLTMKRELKVRTVLRELKKE